MEPDQDNQLVHTQEDNIEENKDNNDCGETKKVAAV